jgi:F-type H+-transporting ATPase subunit gamma
MSDSLVNLRHKLGSARQLASVVRAMKAVAATSIAQYEAAVAALADYSGSVELGLSLSLRDAPAGATPASVETFSERTPRHDAPTVALIFGSDQGLVGRFNEEIAEYALQTLRKLPGPKAIWVVGERVIPHLQAEGLAVRSKLLVPNSVAAITSLVDDIQLQIEDFTSSEQCPVYVFHHQPRSAARYQPAMQRLLPFDTTWRSGLIKLPWPGSPLPEILGGGPLNLPALIHEYLFICLYKACAESLASENASRLEAMQRAEKNIDHISDELHRSLSRLRQASIDSELFDVVAGFNALGGSISR